MRGRLKGGRSSLTTCILETHDLIHSFSNDAIVIQSSLRDEVILSCFRRLKATAKFKLSLRDNKSQYLGIALI